MTNSNGKNRATRAPRLQWVPIAMMKVSARAQREFRPAHAAEFAADFDLEALGYPVVNHRDGTYFIVDGQHRIAALKMIGWGDQQVQCECYDGLSEAEEAELFLRRDRRRAVRAFDKFRIGVVAERDEECEIERIVQAQGLRISADKTAGSIHAVTALRKVYTRDGGDVLARALRVARDSYGDAGYEAAVIDGLGLFCGRYNGQLNDEKAVQRLSAYRNGVKGLLQEAERLKLSTGAQKMHCVAAAAVEIYNRGRGGKKLPSWWREDA